MSKSPLGDFNYSAVNYLIHQDVDMVYDYGHHMTQGGELLGIYHYEKRRVYIYPSIKQKRLEDITILHEWLHAYERVMLDRRFTECQVDWWAFYHHRRDRILVEYIRSLFPHF